MTTTTQQKAIRLLDVGSVCLIQRTLAKTEAAVIGDHGIYVVTLSRAGVSSCSCPWGQLRQGDKITCSHVKALALCIGQPLPE